MNKVQIELTKEQKECVEYPLNEQILIIDADPGTGKTEILRHRVKFIHQENQKQRKFILILAVGKNISLSIKRKLKEEGLKKIHHSLRTVIPEFSHPIPPCEDADCPKCQEHNQPIILTCTIHSIAYWMVKQVFITLLTLNVRIYESKKWSKSQIKVNSHHLSKISKIQLLHYSKSLLVFRKN